jgi:hypothetical protein
MGEGRQIITVCSFFRSHNNCGINVRPHHVRQHGVHRRYAAGLFLNASSRVRRTLGPLVLIDIGSPDDSSIILELFARESGVFAATLANPENTLAAKLGSGSRIVQRSFEPLR